MMTTSSVTSVILLFVLIVLSEHRKNGFANAYSVKGDPYIYPTPYEPPNSSFPVIDYRLPVNVKNYNHRPDFIYNPPLNVYRVVEFYVHWCGRCRAFKSHYIAITRRIVELAAKQNKTVMIHAVSCTPNKPLCVAQSIKGYPKVKLFRGDGDTIGTFLPFESFAPYQVLEKLRIPIPIESELEEDNNMAWDANGAIADAERDLHGLNETDATAVNLHQNDGRLHTLLSHALDYFVPVPEIPIQHTFSNLPQEDQRKLDFILYQHPKRTHTELKNDIHLSFDFIMRHGVYMEDGPLSHERYTALHSFLLVMQHTIPATWSAFHKLITELITDFHFVGKTEQYLIGVLDDHPVPGNVTEWSPSCTHGGDPSLGFPCGIWELFHTVTVGVVHYNIIAEKPLGTEMVGRMIKDFIRYFFPCDYCREHFMKQYDACEYNRCTRLTHDSNNPHNTIVKPKTKADLHKSAAEQDQEIKLKNTYNVTMGMELPLWLLEVHNGVNVRLLHERVNAENERRIARNAKQLRVSRSAVAAGNEPIITITVENDMDVLWPSRIECPQCWIIQHPDVTTDPSAGPANGGGTAAASISTLSVATTATILQYNREAMTKYLVLSYGDASDDEDIVKFQKEVFMSSHKVMLIHEERIHTRHLIAEAQQHTIQIQKLITYIVICLLTLLIVSQCIMRKYMSGSPKKSKKGNHKKLK